MRRYDAPRVLLVGILLLLSPHVAFGQFNSVPIFYTPSRAPENHWTFGVATGRGLNEESGELWALVGEVGRRINPVVDVKLGGGVFWPKDVTGRRKARGQYGGLLSLRLNPGPNDVTFSLFGGAAYASFGSSTGEVNLPLGVAVAYYKQVAKGPMPQLWATVRYAGRILDIGSDSPLQSGVGLSAGANYGLACGIGAGLAIDWSYLMDRKIDTVSVDASNRWVAGLFLRLRRCD